MAHRRLRTAAVALLAAATLAGAGLLAAPSGAQTTFRVIEVINFGTVTDGGGYTQVGLESDQAVMQCAGAWPIYGAHTAAQVMTRQPLPGAFVIRVWNDEGEVQANRAVRLNCTIDATFTEPVGPTQLRQRLQISREIT